MNEKKKYGLIIPKKDDISAINQKRKLKAFDSSDNDDSVANESAMDWAESAIKNSGISGQKATQRRLLKEALEEDSTVFQYDDIYDEMKSSADTKAKALKKEVANKPKYINTILRHAQKRKIDLEKRQERKNQKERDAEGDEFIDKEKFVTKSYLKKLEEINELEKAEKLEKLREERDDVLKHKNLNDSRFYKGLYKLKMGEDIVQEIKTEVVEDDAKTLSSSSKKNSSAIKEKSMSKKYSSLSESWENRGELYDNVEVKKEPLSHGKLDDDSDDKNNSEEESRTVSAYSYVENVQSPESRERKKKEKLKESRERFKQLFTKRTVGEKFDEAVQRYFERKAGQSIAV